MTLEIDVAGPYLLKSVGGYLFGTCRGADFCTVCSTPVGGSYVTCVGCNANLSLAQAGALQLADQVLPLTYIDDGPQSKLLMHGYKGDYLGGTPQDELFLNVALMLTLGFLIHQKCIELTHGLITAVSYVPSRRITPNESVKRIAEFISLESGLPLVETRYIGAQPPIRGYQPSGFAIYPHSVALDHVLIIDDTWTTGGNAQSLATAFKNSGAGKVTILVAGWWLKVSWKPSGDFISGAMKNKPYNPFDCPISGNSTCPI